MARRFLTAAVLIFMTSTPFFQYAYLLIASTINGIYLFVIRPLQTKQENRIELFNEFCILLCTHVYSIFLRGEGTVEFINISGWIYMGISCFNILINLAIVLF